MEREGGGAWSPVGREGRMNERTEGGREDKLGRGRREREGEGGKRGREGRGREDKEGEMGWRRREGEDDGKRI